MRLLKVFSSDLNENELNEKHIYSEEVKQDIFNHFEMFL